MEKKLKPCIFFLLSCLLFFSKGSNAQTLKLIHYWDFNNTQPSSGAGMDSLGTATFPLPAQYSTIPSGNPRMVYSHPSADGILDNGTGGSFINDLKVLGNDSGGTAAGNLYVRGRNPSLGDAFFWYLPTTGYKNVIITYATEVSSTKSGPQYEKFQYSPDGGVTWDSVPANAITTTGTVSGSFVNVNNSAFATWQLVQVNFSAITVINNNSNFIFKISQGGSNATGASGNVRYDNISLSGDTNLSTTPLAATIGSSTNIACFNTNTGSATVTASGGNPPYTYNWAPSGGTNATASNLSAGSYTVTITDASSSNTTATVILTQPTPLRDSIASSINNLCNSANNGSATLGVKGGTPPYTYTWSNGANTATASNLSAGSYSVTVTDANECSSPTATVTITQPSAISVTASTTNASCGKSNGSASVTSTTGGTAPYAYSWSNGATTTTVSGLIAGNYTLTVTDHNGCTTSTIVSVIDGGGPSITISSSTNVLCNGASTGSITASVSGGASPYTYSWSNGASTATANNLSAGSYSITVTDANNCSDNKIVTITQPSAIGVTTSITNASCGKNNGSASVTSTTGGTAPYVYSWSNGTTATEISSVVTGSYTLTVTDHNGCTRLTVVNILNNSGPSLTISSTNILCNGTNTGSATVSVSGGASPYTYSWSPSGGTNAIASNLSAGTYIVNVADANGCAATASILLTQPASALADSVIVSNVNCNGGSNGSATANVSGGTSPYSYSWAPVGGTDANATGLIAGTYTVTITDANKCSVNTKISITQPTALTASVSNTNATCGNNNGTAAITVSGGASPYNYNWLPSGGNGAVASNLSAGAYTVTVTDKNSCSTSFTTFIAQANAPTVLIHYWDFNNTLPATGKGGDSLGTATFPLPAQYSIISGGNARMVYSHPSADGILDNGTPGSFINDLKVLGNDSSGTAAGNLYVRGRNPSLGDAFYWYLPTTGYKNAVITYATEVSSTTAAPQYEKFQYSPDGGVTWDSVPASSISAAGTVSGSFVNVNSSAYTSWQLIQINFSSIAVANNNPNFIFKINQAGSNATEASGNCRYDNVSLSGDSAVAPLTIVSQPSAQTACSGNSASFAVSVSGGYHVTYQWQQNSGSGFNNLTNSGIYSGVNDDTLKISAVSNVMNNDSYRCIINGYCPVDSTTAATLTVPVITATISSLTNVACFGSTTASATVSVSGGTLPYTYGWTPNVSSAATANNLSAGTYSVTVTDVNGCSSSAITVSITQPSALKDSIVSFNNELCNGGKIGNATVSASGGTSPYTYNWSSGATTATASNLTAGIYSVTVKDANGCSSSTLTVSIAQPSAISVSASGTNASCGKSNGSASVTSTTGGTSPYTYTWSNGATTTTVSNLAAATYTLTVTDHNGCTGSTTVSILNNGGPSATISSESNILCNGSKTGIATVSVSGGTSPYTYGWTPNVSSTATANNLSAGTYSVTVTDANGCSSSTATITITQPAAISVAASGTNASCGKSNGSASVTSTTGGTSPYAYSWSNGSTTTTASNIAAGTYTLNVTDHNGCTGSTTVSILNNGGPSATISSETNILCNGSKTGSATVSVSGGTSPYTYGWTPNVSSTATANNLSAGSYSVTVTDANGCSSSTATVTITQPAALKDSLISSNELCNGGNTGSATVNVSGGTSPYTYAWSDGATTATTSNLSTGTYSVTVTDANGCSSSTATITITQPAAISVAASGTNASCGKSNGSASVTSTTGGTSPYAYSWSNGSTTTTASNIAAGTYTLTITDHNGCTGSTAVNILNNGGPSATLVSATNVTCFGNANGSATISVSGGTSPYTYGWTPNVSSTATANNLSAGTYSVTVTDANGCSSSTATITITQPSAISVAASGTNASCGKSNGSASVTSTTGGTSPYAYSWSNGSTTTTASNLAAGTYTLTITDHNGCSGSTAVNILNNGGPSATLVSATSVTCFGNANGSATISVSGGTSPYTYGWTPNVSTTAIANNLSAGTYSVTVTVANGCSSSTATITITQPAAISVAASGTNASCGKSNGSASVTSTTGGTSPYTYTWSNGATTTTASNLAAATYTLTVTDHNGCGSSTAVNILNNGGPSATLVSATNVTCFGNANGNATISVSGGTSPYTYGWTPNVSSTATANNLSAGTYSVTVTDANGCSSSTETVTITQPSAISVAASGTNASCGKSNGSASVTSTTGGTSPYAYTWSNGSTTTTASNLAAATYTLTVSDHNGCTSSTSVSIISTGGPSVTLFSSTNILCNGSKTGSATVSVSGGTSPYTYGWTPNVSSTATANNLSAGTYSVTVTDANGCSSSTATVTITQPSALKDSLISSNELCNGGNTGSATVNVSGGIAPYTYAWSNGVTTAKTSNLSTGTYSVTITDANGCSIKVSVIISQPGAIVIIPSSSSATCTNSSGSASVNVSGGTSPYTYNWSNGATTSMISNLTAGTYSITVTDKNGCSANTKIVVGQGSGITAVTSYTMATCTDHNGSASVVVSGGTSPYTYAWSTSPVQTKATATGLSAGTYTCVITDKTGCSSNIIVNVPGTAETVSVIAITNDLCDGGRSGSITVSVSGGTSPYTYIWSPVGGFNATANNLGAGTYTVTVIDHKGCVVTAQATITEPALLIDSVITSTLKNVSCNGANNGSVTIGVKGGTAPYTYGWTPNVSSGATASNLSAGTYSVTVGDANGCSVRTLVIKITQPALLRDSAVAFTLKNVSCNGGDNGSITIGVKGGTSPYTYAWLPNVSSNATANNVSAGSYTVTVTDANGCAATTKATITQPALLRDSIVTSSIQNVTCNGEFNGSATVGVKGGTSPYAYQWSNGALTATVRNLAAGTYTATVTDRNGCSVVATVTITQPPLLVSSVVSSTNELCNGNKTGSATVSVSGGTAPYTYQWTPGGETTATVSNLATGTYVVIIKDKNNCTTEAIVTITQPALLRDSAIASALKNVSCNGGNNGSATIGVKGGTSPYTYVWSPNVSSSATASNLSAGSYTITVIDANGCSAITKISVTQPALLRDSIIASSVKNVSCNVNGSATVGVKGGTTPYIYQWTNGATTATASNLTAGSYTVTVTDKNGCSAVASVTITQSAPLISSITSSDNELCNGTRTGSATVSASGGTPPYTYGWIPGGETTATASNLAAGSYTVIVKDKNNCTTQSTVTITQPAKIRDSIVSQANVSCNGANTGSLVIGVKGGTLPYTYIWSPNVSTSGSASNLAADDYLITVTDANGCEGSYLVATITEPSLLDAGITKTTCTTTNTDSATVIAIGGEPPYTYSWSPSGESTVTATKLAPGTYTVTVTDKNKCEAKAVATILNCNDLPLGIDPVDSVANKVTVFPDPTLGNFNIEGVMPGQVIELYSYIGQELSRVTVENNTTMHFDISNRPNGIYLIRIENADGTLATEKKIVKTQ